MNIILPKGVWPTTGGFGILKLLNCDGLLLPNPPPPPLPAALPPLPLYPRDPLPDADPESTEEVDIAEDI